MAVTISTHNGSKVAREHNIRNPKVTSKESHINPNGIHETWIDEKPKQAYQRLFGKAVEDYNAKQKRSDRKITDYYQQIYNDKKKHPVYEMIIAVGDRTDYTDGKLDEKTTKSILREFVNGWQERNPHLTLIGAYYHADEQGAPHAHLDYIPVANGYKRGLETQSALVKALEQQGFSKEGKETAQIQWQRRENAHLESLCMSKGIEVTHPRIEGREHIDTDIFKAEMERQAAEHLAVVAAEKADKHEQKRKELKAEKKQLQSDVSKLQDEKNSLLEDISDAESHLKALQGAILTSQQVSQVSFKKTLTGAIKGISEEELRNLKATAAFVDEMKRKEKDFDKREKAAAAAEAKAEIANALRKKDEERVAELNKEILSLTEKYDIAQELAAEANKRRISSVMSREQIKKNAAVIHQKIEAAHKEQEQSRRKKGHSR